jgi:predicted GH43/DUF377 family glycosyl hydrolase
MQKFDFSENGCYGGWRKYENNPVMGEELGEEFDPNIIMMEDGTYRMYFGWRTLGGIAFVEGTDGIHWSEPVMVLEPRKETGWENEANRQTVVVKDNKYYMWYTGQMTRPGYNDVDISFLANETCNNIYGGTHSTYMLDHQYLGFSCIGFATSDDGVLWERMDEPVLIPDAPWEKDNLMCPHVIWDEEMGLFRMWYSGGGYYEPDDIGYATSKDGIHWNKHEQNPVFRHYPKHIWERERLAAPVVFKEKDWYYMFYIGFEDIHKASICAARSKDGISNWERHPCNPLITCGKPGDWDGESVYKPWLLHQKDKHRWLLWYNGRRDGMEHMGMAIYDGDDLWSNIKI